MGANRATRSSRRPLLGACVRRDQEAKNRRVRRPSARSTQNLVRDVSGLETSCKKARAAAKQAAAAGIHTPAGLAVLSARLPTCEARKVRMHAGRAGTSFPVLYSSSIYFRLRSGFDTYASLANTQR